MWKLFFFFLYIIKFFGDIEKHIVPGPFQVNIRRFLVSLVD